jgi:Serine/threonine protein phosphatase
MNNNDYDTKELDVPATSDSVPSPYSSLVEVDWAALSDKGKVRQNNEDHFLLGKAGRFLDVVSTNLRNGEFPVRSEETGYAMVVADGMGGTEGGEIASRLAIETLINLVLDLPDWIFRFDRHLAEKVMRRSAERYQMIDAEIGRQAEADPRLANMGTTMTGAVSLGGDLIVTHVGDSRAYLQRQGRLQQLTRDQTLVQSLLDLGQIAPEEVASHPMRHVLTQALGQRGGNVRVEVQRIRLKDGDCLLLCTDGLTEMVPDTQISGVISKAENAEKTCRTLVDMANERGGRDNITVALARYRFPQ